MLLIHPPVSLPGEAPPGIAKLAGVLRGHGIPCRLLDANLEGMLALLAQGRGGAAAVSDTWTRGAFRRLDESLAAVRDRRAGSRPDRYRRAVLDINRALAASGAGTAAAASVSLADYRDSRLAPVRSSDLLRAAERPADNPFHPYFAARLAALLDTEAPPAVGFSLNYLSQALCTFAMAGYVKRLHPRLPVILGGGLVTSWLRGALRGNPFAGLIDETVAGPGEDRLLELLGAARPRGHRAPAYDDLPLGAYLAPGVVLPYSTAYGCWWRRCSFCPEAAEGNTFRPLPLRTVTADLERLVACAQPDLIHFTDNALSPAALAHFADHPPGRPWYGFARITEELADPSFCRALREAGCVMLKIGLESGAQEVLDALNKGIDLSVAARAIPALAAAGIALYVYLLFGTPAETAAAARQTLDFTVRHRASITFLNLALFNLPLAGAGELHLSASPFSEGDLSLYGQFAHPHGWDRRAVRRFVEREFRRHPAVAPIMRRDPPLFGSTHAPLLVMADRRDGKEALPE